MSSPEMSNPFPRDPVVKNSIDQLPDFRETESYKQAVAMIENFRENFPLPDSGGMAIGIRGRFGSGKTHLVFQLMRELQTGGTLQSDDIPEPSTQDSLKWQSKVLYAKADKVDALDLYINHFARRLEADDLKRVVSLHLAKLLRKKGAAATEQTSTEPRMIALGDVGKEPIASGPTLTQIAQVEVDKIVATHPQDVLRLVEQELLPVTGLSREFQDEIETTGRDLGPDFFRAYSKVTDTELGALALRWIQGGLLSNSERLDLGLESAGITQASDAKQALRFLLAAFKKADFAVMFCLDEFERFSSRGSTDDLKASAGLLKDLAETFKETGHLLLVSGVNDAWVAMKKDVFDRIKPSDIVEMRLAEDEARGLLDAYCRHSYGAVEEVFETSALHLLYEASNQNTRRVLNLAHHGYEIATDTTKSEADSVGLPIRVQHVEQATNELLSDAKRQDALDQAIQSIALDLRLPVQKDFRQNGLVCDYILGDQQNPQVAIEITKSIFKLGEVSAAREIAKRSQLTRHEFPQTRFCVVIVGYSTKEVRDELAKVVDRVFSFDEESFPSEFREFLKAMSSQPQELEVRVKSQEAAYQELLKKFDQLEQMRRDEIEQLKRTLESLQSESLRVRETEREKRVTDKMGETLNKLSDLLALEQELTVRAVSESDNERRFTLFRKEIDDALRLIDEQRAYLRRAEILNERLSQADEFSFGLRRFSESLDRVEELWNRSIDLAVGFSDRSYVRNLYRERKDILSELEGVHYRRSSTEGGALGRIGQVILRNKLPLALGLLSVLGITSLIYSLYSGWNDEKSAISYYDVQLNKIQGQVRRTQLDPGSVSRGDSSDILQYMINLEDSPGKAYLVSRLAVERLPEMRNGLNSLRDEISFKGSYSDTMHLQLATVDQLCSQWRQELAAISLSSFAANYFAANRLLLVIWLSPLLLLISFIFYRNRLMRMRRYRKPY